MLSPVSGLTVVDHYNDGLESPKHSVRDVNIEECVEAEGLPELREEMLKATSFDRYTDDELDRMFWHVRDFIYFAGTRGNYGEALEAEKLLEYLRIEIADRRVNVVTGRSMDPFKQRLQKQQQKWIKELLDFDEETERRQLTLEQRFQAELAEFEQNWETKRLRQYQKQSPKLRDMVLNERTMQCAGHFKEAQSMKRAIVTQTRAELDEAQFVANRDYEENKERLIRKQQEEMMNMFDTRQHQRDAVILKQKKEMDVFVNRGRLVQEKAQSRTYSWKMPVPDDEESLLRPLIVRDVMADPKEPTLLPKVVPPRLWSKDMTRPRDGGEGPYTKCVPKTRRGKQKVEIPVLGDVRDSMKALKSLHEKKIEADFGQRKVASSRVPSPNKDKDKLAATSPPASTRPTTPKRRHKQERKNSSPADPGLPRATPILPLAVKMDSTSIMQKMWEKNKRLFPEGSWTSRRGRLVPMDYVSDDEEKVSTVSSMQVRRSLSPRQSPVQVTKPMQGRNVSTRKKQSRRNEDSSDYYELEEDEDSRKWVKSGKGTGENLIRSKNGSEKAKRKHRRKSPRTGSRQDSPEKKSVIATESSEKTAQENEQEKRGKEIKSIDEKTVSKEAEQKKRRKHHRKRTAEVGEDQEAEPPHGDQNEKASSDHGQDVSPGNQAKRLEEGREGAEHPSYPEQEIREKKGALDSGQAVNEPQSDKSEKETIKKPKNETKTDAHDGDDESTSSEEEKGKMKTRSKRKKATNDKEKKGDLTVKDEKEKVASPEETHNERKKETDDKLRAKLEQNSTVSDEKQKAESPEEKSDKRKKETDDQPQAKAEQDSTMANERQREESPEAKRGKRKKETGDKSQAKSEQEVIVTDEQPKVESPEEKHDKNMKQKGNTLQSQESKVTEEAQNAVSKLESPSSTKTNERTKQSANDFPSKPEQDSPAKESKQESESSDANPPPPKLTKTTNNDVQSNLEQGQKTESPEEPPQKPQSNHRKKHKHRHGSKHDNLTERSSRNSSSTSDADQIIVIGGKHELERASPLSKLAISPERYDQSPRTDRRASRIHTERALMVQSSPRALLSDLSASSRTLRQTYGPRSQTARFDYGTNFQAAETISSGMTFVKR